jgi:DNA-binding MarR family transcriptional regulator
MENRTNTEDVVRDAARDSACYCTSVRKVSRLITGFYGAAIASSGLKITQYSLLNHLLRLGSASMKELSDALLLERTTLTRNLDLLAKKKLVEIVPVADSKAHRIRLTRLGEKALAQARPLWEQAQNRMESLLTPQERHFLRHLASRLFSALP